MDCVKCLNYAQEMELEEVQKRNFCSEKCKSEYKSKRSFWKGLWETLGHLGDVLSKF